MIDRLRSLLSALFRRDRFEDGMADELRFHLDAYAEDLVRAGVPRAEAARRARLEFGGVESIKMVYTPLAQAQEPPDRVTVAASVDPIRALRAE